MLKIYLFFILTTFSSFALSMNVDERNKIIKEIMVRNIIYLSHDSICALALVDRNCNRLIKETVEARKNYFRTYTKYYNKIILNTPELRKEYISRYGLLDTHHLTADAQITWHRYGGAYVLLGKDNKRASQDLMFKIIYLMDDGSVRDVGKKIQFFNGLDYKCHFDRQGEVYLYRLRDSVIAPTKDTREFETNIIEYSLNFQDMSKECCCFIELEDLTYWRLGRLLEFPALVQAFFKSTQVCEKSLITRRMRHCETGELREIKEEVKVYNIRGVTIPDDFRTIKKGSQEIPNLFERLPEALRDAILNKYEKQQREKNVAYEIDMTFVAFGAELEELFMKGYCISGI